MVNLSNYIQTESVIFDFDGVIVDTEPLHYRAFQHILEPLGLGFTWEKYCEEYMGYDDRDAFIAAHSTAGKFLPPEDLRLLITRKASTFIDIIKAGVQPYPGVVDLITKLKLRKMPLAICSGALRSDIMPILALLGIGDHFDVVITAEDVSKSKPDPESYRLAFAQLKKLYPDTITLPAASVAIEDTPAGIISAHGADLKVIGVTNSYDARQLDMADIVICTLEELGNQF